MQAHEDQHKVAAWSNLCELLSIGSEAFLSNGEHHCTRTEELDNASQNDIKVNNDGNAQLGHDYGREDNVQLDWDMQEEAFNGDLEKEATRFEKHVGCRDADGVQ
ncbi:hypothetical protein H2200_003553 [Cladophialophora chaetospira]|uniref:Uncharacterized protein n=1 Tax=Cladophialophora chaetospira TaxID=386627 RepID=A0AA39CL73_9EURO|nr:hypothetical protein H2200_003553 [Cladophialophora chaetospira]